LPDRISVFDGDITTLAVDAIVNAANERLAPGGGVCGAIHRAAGLELARACAKLASCPTGEARITPGFDLQARFVIHAVGPVWHGGNAGEEKLLASCYRASLDLAAENRIRSIAFPAISTGIYGFPLEQAARIAIATVQAGLARHGTIERVVFCCFGDEPTTLYRRLLAEVAPAPNTGSKHGSGPLGPLAAKLDALVAAEQSLFQSRTPKSRALLARARGAMPSGVPMPWMAGLYPHDPVFVAGGRGSAFEDVDGNRYVDFNLVDLAGSLGFAPAPVVEAVKRRMDLGSSFLLPTEDGLIAAELLQQRTGLPFWQITGSATVANTEALRLARFVTGRERLLMFEGKYHGHGDDMLVSSDSGAAQAELLGLPRGIERKASTVPFNDLEALAGALAEGDTACLMAEPMLTNCNIVFPDDGFWTKARKLLDRAGALLVIDEAHTHAFAYGGLTRLWGLKPDILVLGKGLGTGVPFAAYGVGAPLAAAMEKNLYVDPQWTGLALGGTTYGSALALAAARAALESCLREEDYARVTALGRRLAFGLQALFDRHGLAWRAPVIGGRSGWVLGSSLPRNAAESRVAMHHGFAAARKLFFANRGVWDAIASAGPGCSFQHGDKDVDLYLEVSDAFLTAVAG
jgi:glutamate-1-semialdehyde 2,1-aminomutase